jgi:hypothetical protein
VFDLNLITLYVHENREQAALPGVVAVPSPRRTARGRSGEQLVLFLSPATPPGQPSRAPATVQMPPEEAQTLLDRAAQAYYQIPGTVTSALRSLTESINQQLIERNATKGIPPVIATLSVVVVHGNNLYLAQCGPNHAFRLTTQAVEQYTDLTMAGRGLGSSSTTNTRFYQSIISPGMCLLLCPDPPATWNTTTLAGVTKLALDSLRRRLLTQTQSELMAVAIQFSEGNGKVNLMRPSGRVTASEPPHAGAQAAAAPAAESASPAEPQTIIEQPIVPMPDRPVERTASTPEPPAAKPLERPQPVFSNPVPASPPPPKPALIRPEPTPAAAAAKTPPAPSPSGPQTRSEQVRARTAQLSSPAQPARQPALAANEEPVIQEFRRVRKPAALPGWVVSAWKRLKALNTSIATALSQVIQRLLPGTSEQPQRLSPAAAILISIAVPLAVVAIASAVYIERGRLERYRFFLGQSMTTAQEAASYTDPTQQRNTLQSALLQLDKAETYQKTDETRALRQRTQGKLDELDQISRLTFQSAIEGSLPSTTRVDHIVSNGNDLFLLDGNEGRVIYTKLSGRGFDIQPKFQCGPGQVGALLASNVIDILPGPVSGANRNALMALDQNGNILFCQTDGTVSALSLPTPESEWLKIQAFANQGSQIYVLDSQANAIWVYTLQNDNIPEKPKTFFGNEIPFLGDAVDLAVTSQDLFILHKDGHMTLCSITALDIEPTRCKDPAPFTDSRPGKELNPTNFPETRFSQMQFISLPDQSIFALDPGSATVYQFSRILHLYRLMRPEINSSLVQPGQAATAFSVNPDRTAFLAFGNQVLFAYIP